MHLRRFFLLALALLPVAVLAQRAELPPDFHRWEMQVDGLARTGFIHAPETAKSAATPVVFAFHGHGGTAPGAVRGFPMHREWPEAISVYLQGVNTPGRLTDPEGK